MPHGAEGTPGAFAWDDMIEAGIASVVMVGTGIDPTGAADSTTAIQAKLDSLPSAGGWAHFPAGTFKVTGLTLSKRATITGAGGNGHPNVAAVTTITCASTTADAFAVTVAACTITDLAIYSTASSACTAGSGLRLTDGRGVVLTRVTVDGFYDCIRFDLGEYSGITDCRAFNPVHYGMFLNAPGNPDGGDQIIQGCTIVGGTSGREHTALAGIRWESGGGLKIIGCKIDRGGSATMAVGIDLCVADGAATSVIVINGNSIENCGKAISLTQKGSTGLVGKIAITGNEVYNAGGTGIFIAPVAQGYVGNITIISNVFSGVDTSIDMDVVTGVVIGPNSHGLGAQLVAGPVVKIGTYVVDLQLAQQQVTGDNVVLVTDTSAHQGRACAQAAASFEREINNVTSSSVYTTLYTHTPIVYSGGVYEVTICGTLAGNGPFMVRAVRSFVRSGGAVTCATVGTDATAGVAADLTFDTSTTSGSVLIGVKRNSVPGGTALDGVISLRVIGQSATTKKGV